MSALGDNRARQHFESMTDDEKRQAVRDLSAIHHAYTIAAATGLSIEAVRAILAESEGGAR